MKCEAVVERGPRAGQRCRFRACMLTVLESAPRPVCGMHAKAWYPRALARIAYYDPKFGGWP